MSNIQVDVYIPDEDYDNPAMVTDFYEFSMANSLFLKNYHFNDRDIRWLLYKGMSPEFCEYLKTYRWKGNVHMLREGTVCYPQVPMVRIECDMVGAILIETYLLQTMNFHSLITTKATKITGLSTNHERNVMEFGTR